MYIMHRGQNWKQAAVYKQNMLPVMAMLLCLSTLVVETQGATEIEKTKGDGQPQGVGKGRCNTVLTDRLLEMALKKFADMDAHIKELTKGLDRTNVTPKQCQERERNTIDRMQDQIQELIVQSKFQKLSEKYTQQFEQVDSTLATINQECNNKSQYLEMNMNDLQGSMETHLAKLTKSFRQMKKGLQTERADREQLKASVMNLQTHFSKHVTEAEKYWASVSAEYFDPFSTGLREWRLVFKGTASIGKSVYKAYVHSASANVEPGCKQLDTNLSCHHHYRNNAVLDNWGTNIQEVALVVLHGGKSVQHIIFDGRNTDYINWMSAARVKSSSWTDVKQGPHNYFSVQGDGGWRRFFVNRSYGGCNKDAGWFVARDQTTGRPCDWEKGYSFPVFKFTRGKTYENWLHGNVGIADAMAIFVKYSPFGPVV